MEIALGVFYHFIGGLASGSFYLPFKRVRSWAWESYWIVGGFCSWLIAPWVAAWLTVPGYREIIAATPADTLFWTYFMGLLWGIGGLTFGLSIRYLGLSLGMSVALGFCSALGALIPPIYRDLMHVDGVTLTRLFASAGGRLVLVGVVVCLAGISICGRAGMLKESELPEAAQKASIKEFNLGLGLIVATVSGILSACFNFGIEAGHSMAQVAVAQGANPLFQNNVVFVVVLWGGLTTNLIWCVALNLRNWTFGDYFNAEAPLANNYFFSALAGTIWFLQFFFYGMGASKLSNGARLLDLAHGIYHRDRESLGHHAQGVARGEPAHIRDGARGHRDDSGVGLPGGLRQLVGSAVEVRVARPITSIADLRLLAKRRLPSAIFDYADRGSYDEVTPERNRRDLEALAFRQRVAVDVSARDLSTTLVGQPVSMPLAIAPTGLAGFYHRDGEIAGARAAQTAGIPFCLSTMSICSLEDVTQAIEKPIWFQLYLMRDREFSEELIARARAARCPALVLTLDLQVQGLRRQEIKRGLTIPPRLTLRNMLDVAVRPSWAWGVLFGKRRTFGNVAHRMEGTDGLVTLAQWIATQFDPSVSWRDVEWVRNLWPGKLIVKGLLDPDDARRACDAGADAVIVSNHGGRQLDGAPSSISMLPHVAEAVGARCEVLFDGGVQSGQDMLKALALGARGCLIGKAFLYALGALGERGVTLALEIVRKELDVTMALCGQTSAQAVGRGILLS